MDRPRPRVAEPGITWPLLGCGGFCSTQLSLSSEEGFRSQIRPRYHYAAYLDKSHFPAGSFRVQVWRCVYTVCRATDGKGLELKSRTQDIGATKVTACLFSRDLPLRIDSTSKLQHKWKDQKIYEVCKSTPHETVTIEAHGHVNGLARHNAERLFRPVAIGFHAGAESHGILEWQQNMAEVNTNKLPTPYAKHHRNRHSRGTLPRRQKERERICLTPSLGSISQPLLWRAGAPAAG
ncbi:hypothetical protein B0T19DRAFT_134356 [Cercophora scortea]|uniref:Uncharacterized protein n=1 Tax=Cercophora scortea TaxID=314031 RepID=A0AAE0MIH6_9PEZI|nr:hypothetical protein B0T19DRAFT_134356 [Cercophora scortea]